MTSRIAVVVLLALAMAFAIGSLLGYVRHPSVKGFVELLEGAEDEIYQTVLDRESYLKWYFDRNIYDATWVDRIHPNIAKTDPSSLIRIDSDEGATEMRRQLRARVWRDTGFPVERRPDEIVPGVEEPQFADLPNLRRIDRLAIRMRNGYTANPLLFLPERRNGEFVIYHQGHLGHFAIGKHVIERFLEEGYGVVGMSMPTLPPNTGPDLDNSRFGHLAPKGHSLFRLYESPDFSPMAYFVEPVVAVTTYLIETYQQPCITITGISGGGWTATLAAALDERVCRSYPVASSLPPYVLGWPPNSGVLHGYEEFHPDMLAVANILEHYVLAAQGEGRAHKMIFNQYDPVNYRGIGATTFLEPVRDAVARAGGGAFDVHIDATHAKHRISEHALDWIIEDILRTSAQLFAGPD